MTSRIPGLAKADSQAESAAGDSVVPASGVPLDRLAKLSSAMVNEAVDAAAESCNLRSDVAAVYKTLLARRLDSEVAQQFYNSNLVTDDPLVSATKKPVTIGYSLSDSEVADLVRYAPEFELRFTNSINHDHPMAAACRLLDHRIISSRLPKGVAISDVGGNPAVHMRDESGLVHVCGPQVDVKDPSRHKLRRMKIRKLCSSEDPCVARQASRYVQRDPTFVCDVKAQECKVVTPCATSIHVYDISMSDWPVIMDSKSIDVVEGCVLFSDEFWESKSGELGVSKVRYTIDDKRTTFSMGFVGSPSWWYTHDLCEYLRYGTDQLIQHGSRWFSYKVIQRRGDTLFFRLLRLPGSPTGQSLSASFVRPGIKLVRVSGFKPSKTVGWSAPSLTPGEWLFPDVLWQQMVGHAERDFGKGVLDYHKMLNFYRTKTAKQVVNSVVVSGGQRVPTDELRYFVAFACVAGAIRVIVAKRTVSFMTTQVVAAREDRTKSTFRVAYEALTAVVSQVASLPLAPFKYLADSIVSRGVGALREWCVDWEPCVEVVTMQVQTIRSTGQAVVTPVGPVTLTETAMRGYMLGKVATSNLRQVVQNDEFRSQLEEQFQLPSTAPKAGPPSSGGVAESVTLVSSGGGERSVPDVGVTAMRRAAILEHIQEVRGMASAVEASCRRAYGALFVNGIPTEPLLKSRAELYNNPDAWLVVNGVVTKSALGLPVEDFAHSAVYTPRPDPSTSRCVRSVVEDVWVGLVDGEEVQHVNHVLADASYTGWVLTTDDLQVHNGVEIEAALKAAVNCPHDYRVRLNLAPPGSGKTYRIVHTVRPEGDLVMCPVRESITDTRSRVLELIPGFPEPKLRVRTVDSYLVNCFLKQGKPTGEFSRLLADECFMAHAGKWYAIAALTGVESIEAYGDDRQIPHIPRVQASKVYVKLVGDVTEWEWTTRRCPASAVAAWGSEYDWKVRSVSKVADEGLKMVSDTSSTTIPAGCVMLGMYQADKKELRHKYALWLRDKPGASRKNKKKASGRSGVRVMTTHESEGKTFTHTWLHRFDRRKRVDNFSLYDQAPHVLVGMSRHTHSFLYVCPADLGDLVSKWISRSKDPRRVAAAKDLSTLGLSVEFK